MPSEILRAAVRQVCVLASAAIVTTFAISALAPSSTESAAANGDTRTLHLYHTHTHESMDATFRVDGHFDRAVLRQLNHFLRDWRNDDEHEMDPRLFDAIWEAYRTAGATDPIQIYSAYRSPQTNAMLRRRSRAVAEHSQHMLGKAMDTTMPGFPMHRIREAAMKLQNGGVGWYPSANFVHIDVGGVRSWPRMSYAQLESLFPDGKTVHIAANGKTLPGYDQARLEIAQRGGDVEVPPAQESPGFFAWLFGSGGGGGSASEGDEQDRRAPAAVAQAAPPAPAPQPVQTAQAEAPQLTGGPQPAAAVQPPAPALAYAPSAQQAQFVDARARADGQQVASLETAEPEVVAPMPPRRPTGLASEDESDIPLPPARPGAFDRMQTASIRYTDAQPSTESDKIGNLITSNAITSTSAGVPMIRRASLPSIITRGGRDRPLPPNQVLSFAAVESVPGIRQVPMPVARPADLVKPLALRSARRRAFVALASVAPDMRVGPIDASAGPVKLDCPKVMGLRRAASAAP